MNKLLCIVVLVLLGYGTRHFVGVHQRWREWDQVRAEADFRLVSETKAYQYSSQYQVFDCPTRQPLSRDDLMIRVGQDRMRAIQIMRQKPGTLTAEEARRLDEYTAWFGQLAK